MIAAGCPAFSRRWAGCAARRGRPRNPRGGSGPNGPTRRGCRSRLARQARALGTILGALLAILLLRCHRALLMCRVTLGLAGGSAVRDRRALGSGWNPSGRGGVDKSREAGRCAPADPGTDKWVWVGTRAAVRPPQVNHMSGRPLDGAQNNGRSGATVPSHPSCVTQPLAPFCYMMTRLTVTRSAQRAERMYGGVRKRRGWAPRCAPTRSAEQDLRAAGRWCTDRAADVTSPDGRVRPGPARLAPVSRRRRPAGSPDAAARHDHHLPGA
ncbi:hypothetical protein SGLAM104S_09703 [Streptomyces glaucescens]